MGRMFITARMIDRNAVFNQKSCQSHVPGEDAPDGDEPAQLLVHLRLGLHDQSSAVPSRTKSPLPAFCGCPPGSTAGGCTPVCAAYRDPAVAIDAQLAPRRTPGRRSWSAACRLRASPSGSAPSPRPPGSSDTAGSREYSSPACGRRWPRSRRRACRTARPPIRTPRCRSRNGTAQRKEVFVTFGLAHLDQLVQRQRSAPRASAAALDDDASARPSVMSSELSILLMSSTGFAVDRVTILVAVLGSRACAPPR